LLVLVLVVFLAGAVGYFVAGGRIVTDAPTAAPPAPTGPAPATAIAPAPLAPAPTAGPAVIQQTAPATNLPTATPTPDPRFARIERHNSDYFAALNAGDYARAQAVCCTPSWRSRYPLNDWQKNFAGVTDLRFDPPSVRYTAVEASRIIAEVDYSFVNSRGTRQLFTLRWTFVPTGSDWLADEAVAFPQR